MQAPAKCPQCSSDEVLPILYGMPSDVAVERSRRGEVALGGCMVFPYASEYTFKNSGQEWSEVVGG